MLKLISTVSFKTYVDLAWFFPNEGFLNGKSRILKDMFLNKSLYPPNGNIAMKKENCPFCGHRWTRSTTESPITCPNCHRKYLSREELAKIKKGNPSKK